MTDNTELKELATKMLNNLIFLRRKFKSLPVGTGSNAEAFEEDLRGWLSIMRDDTENRDQYQRDCQT